jgi:hypothetical protein
MKPIPTFPPPRRPPGMNLILETRPVKRYAF